MKIVALIMIIGSIALGYLGFNKISQSSKSVEIVGINIEASDESGKQEGYIYLGLAVILFVGGIYTLNKYKK